MFADLSDGQSLAPEKPRFKLAAPEIDARIRELVGAGMSLSEIVKDLGIEVSRTAVHKRVTGLGLTLQQRSFNPIAQKPPEFGRAVSGAEMTKYRRPTRKREKSWLSMFQTEIGALLIGGQYSYAEIWDELKRRHPIVPQLAAQTTARQKSLRFSVWLSRERARAATKATKSMKRLAAKPQVGKGP